ncbi:MAG: FxDxF family PEP-CTERM protein [Sphingomonas sp.]
MSQTFSLATAGSYELNWFDAGRTNNGGPQSYTVSITGGASPVSLGTFTTDHADWQSKSGLFTLDAGTYTLTFAGLSNEDRTSFIDNVSVAGVPEPAAWGMLIGGMGLAGGAMRRRRSQGALSAA